MASRSRSNRGARAANGPPGPILNPPALNTAKKTGGGGPSLRRAGKPHASTKSYPTENPRGLLLKGHQSFTSPKEKEQHEKTQHHVLKPQEKGVETDYISVLQEQVYFLELENNILKSTPSARPTGMGPKSPLDEVLLRLKDKYQDMQISFKAQIQELDGQCRVLSENKLQLEAELARNKTVIDNNSSEVTALKEEHSNDAAQLVELNIQLQDKISQLEVRNLRREAAHADMIRETAQLRSLETEKREKAEDAFRTEERRRQVVDNELSNVKRLLEQKTFELKNKETKEVDTEALLETISTLKARNLFLQTDNVNLNVSLEEVKARIVKGDEVRERLSADNAKLTIHVSELQTTLKKTQTAKLDLEKEKSQLKAAHDSVGREKRMLEVDLKAKEDKIENMQERLGTFVAVEQERQYLKIALAEEKAALVAETKGFQARDALRQKQHSQLVVLETELARAKQNTVEAQSEVTTHRADLDRLQARVLSLTRKLHVYAGLEGLNLNQWKGMVNSNLQIASRINSLMDQLNGSDAPSLPMPSNSFNNTPNLNSRNNLGYNNNNNQLQNLNQQEAQLQQLALLQQQLQEAKHNNNVDLNRQSMPEIRRSSQQVGSNQHTSQQANNINLIFPPNMNMSNLVQSAPSSLTLNPNISLASNLPGQGQADVTPALDVKENVTSISNADFSTAKVNVDDLDTVKVDMTLTQDLDLPKPSESPRLDTVKTSTELA